MLQFERQVTELNSRLVRGELSEPLEPGDAFIAILRNTVPRMTRSERRYVEGLVLGGYQEAVDLVSVSPDLRIPRGSQNLKACQ